MYSKSTIGGNHWKLRIVMKFSVNWGSIENLPVFWIGVLAEPQNLLDNCFKN